jgi:hypothetical protein
VPSDHSESPASDVALSRLQEATVQAVLQQKRLPGGDRPIRLPDVSFLLREDTVLLADENLAGTVSFADAPVPVRILSLEAILEQARAQGDVAFLQFQPAELGEGVIKLTLQAKLAARDPSRRPLGLSGMQVRFEETADGWQAAEEPSFFAA